MGYYVWHDEGWCDDTMDDLEEAMRLACINIKFKEGEGL